MSIVDPTSLAATLDELNEALFYGRPIHRVQRREAASWIAGRQGLPGAYHGMFAPTERDLAEGIVLFSGEKIAAQAAVAHILGEEACRVLLALQVEDPPVQEALKAASEGIAARLGEAWASLVYPDGMYCCGTCTVALWRHLAAGGLTDGPRHLGAGTALLKEHRDGKGRWKRFPFYYTLLALIEIDPVLSREELRYSAPVCERCLLRMTADDELTRRRHELLERALGLC